MISAVFALLLYLWGQHLWVGSLLTVRGREVFSKLTQILVPQADSLNFFENDLYNHWALGFPLWRNASGRIGGALWISDHDNARSSQALSISFIYSSSPLFYQLMLSALNKSFPFWASPKVKVASPCVILPLVTVDFICMLHLLLILQRGPWTENVFSYIVQS